MKKFSRIFFVLSLSATLIANTPFARADHVAEASTVSEAITALLSNYPSPSPFSESTAAYYTKAGYDLLQKEDYMEAAQQLQLALYASPKYALAYYLLAQSYIGLERVDEAYRALLIAKDLNPGYRRAVDAVLAQLTPEKRAAQRLKIEEQQFLRQKVAKRAEEKRKAQLRAQRQQAERIIQKILEVDAEPNQPENEILKLASKPKSPPPGTYICVYRHQNSQNNLITTDLKGYLILEPNGLYRWDNQHLNGNNSYDPLLIPYIGPDNGPIGRYRYESASREVKFLTGLLAQPEITAEYRDSGPDPQIVINFTGAGQSTDIPAKEKPPIEWQAILPDNKALKAESVHKAINILKRAQREGTGEFSVFITGEDKNLAVTPGIHTVYGLDYLKAKDFPNAARELEAALNLNPDYAPAHFLLGLVYTRLHQFNDAQQSLQWAGRLNANYRPEIRVASFLLEDAMWTAQTEQTESAKNFKPPPTGIYVCKQVYFSQAEGFKTEIKGRFFLDSNGTYKWLGEDSIHHYKYDSTNREIKFLSGPLAQPGATAKFRINYTSPAITIKFHTADSLAQKAQPIQWICLREKNESVAF